MKSTKEQLESRGYVSDEDVNNYKSISDDQHFILLKSNKACDRTLGAKLAINKMNKEVLQILCALLVKETKLYTKIALSEAIEKYGVASIEYLIPLLGKIGKNQHKIIAIVDINKKSYPLPRDLAARIIIRIGEPALPYLEEILVSGTYIQKCEAVDAIGHIAFNYSNFQSENILLSVLSENDHDELITWKIIRAFQSFHSAKIEEYLKGYLNDSRNEVLHAEAKRSLWQIQKRKLHNAT